MSPVDIGEIILIVAVFVSGVGSIVYFGLKDEKDN